ncbi:hypothetical protein JR316_0001769 [Psilocybe cubensis]|uniref:Uncharacterized protein n=1 Tax=Psilocybe cubensis TaxID=181762 RepID=A0ACB8HB42_PSICU|nr:hypothetical protein JR316_0001769 [Psilocybe cubensis]KAH9484867.1 hypothetical protein JR316_0001769 [Psilocybe cubensis]
MPIASNRRPSLRWSPQCRYVRNKFESFARVIYRVKQRSLAAFSKTKLSRTSEPVHNSTQLSLRSPETVLILSLPGTSESGVLVPPCPHLFCSNEAPTDDEAKLIIDAIKRAEEEASRLNSILLRKQKFSDHCKRNGRGWERAVTHTIDEVNNFIRLHRGLLSLLRQLPVEILQDIFLIHVIDSINPDYNGYFSKHPALAVSQTCRSWRNVALNFPSLWSRLPPIRIQRSRSKTDTQIEILADFLRRSIGSTLHLCLNTANFIPKSADLQFNHPTVNLLCQHAERWTTFTLFASHLTFPNLRTIKGRLNALKGLGLFVSSIGSSMVPGQIIDFFEEAPLLTVVDIGTPFSRAVSLPFSQLKHYKEYVTSLQECQIEKAIASPVLQTLTMKTRNEAYVFPKSTLSNLVRLYAEFCFTPHLNDDVVLCLGNLTLPAIREIRLLSRSDNMTPSLLRLLRNSSPCLSLKTLVFRFWFINEGDLTAILKLTPSLVHLSCTAPATSDIDFVNIADVTLVPKLERCDFIWPDELSASIPHAINILCDSRCEPLIINPAPFLRLNKLTLSFTGLEGSLLQQQLNRLEGWHPTVTSYTLNALKEQLLERLPTLLYLGYREETDIRSLGENEKVAKLLALINTVMVNEAMDIYSSGIILVLDKIATSQYPSTKNVALAKTILEKWKPMTEDPENLLRRRWAYHGYRTLEYIPIDSELRTTSPTDIIRGVADEQINWFDFERIQVGSL